MLTLLMAISGVGHPHVRWPAAIFYPLRHPTPYAYGNFKKLKPELKTTGCPKCKWINDFPVTPKIIVRMNFKKKALCQNFSVLAQTV
jgi:hypothetical protein